MNPAAAQSRRESNIEGAENRPRKSIAGLIGESSNTFSAYQLELLELLDEPLLLDESLPLLLDESLPLLLLLDESLSLLLDESLLLLLDEPLLLDELLDEPLLLDELEPLPLDELVSSSKEKSLSW